MKVSLSVTPKKFSPGSRVAVEFDKDDWSIGTVVKATPTGYKIDFDYGEENRLIKTSEGRILEVLQKRKLKKPLTKSAVMALVADLKASRAPKKTPTKPSPSVKTPVSAPTHTEPTHAAPKTEDKQEKGLVALVGLPASTWDKLSHQTNRAKMHEVLEHLWSVCNAKLFAGRLHKATIRLQKDAGTHTRRLGSWSIRSRVLSFAPRIFTAPQDKALGVFVHELCHQAVTDIEQVNELVNGGHGPLWSAHMRRCGLDPARYAGSTDPFLTDKEVADRNAAVENYKANRKEAHEQAAEEGLKKFIAQTAAYPRAVTFTDPNTKQKYIGLAAGPKDRAGRRILVVVKQGGQMSALGVPADWIYYLPRGIDWSIIAEDPEYLAYAHRFHTYQ